MANDYKGSYCKSTFAICKEWRTQHAKTNYQAQPMKTSSAFFIICSGQESIHIVGIGTWLKK
jgi:hypothetical protein